MLRFLTAGESHGPSEIVIIEGIPAGFKIKKAYIQIDLNKRSNGAGRGGRGKIETDEVTILSGVRSGFTLGSPITLLIPNLDYKNWSKIMDPDKDSQTSKLTTPRPGHADLAGIQKFGFDDVRNVIERASARETVARVAQGAVCKRFLAEFGIEIGSHTIAIGNVSLEDFKYTFEEVKRSYESDPETRCIDLQTSQKMKETIIQAIKNKDTLGGVIEIIAKGVPPGLGSYIQWDKKIDGRIAGALMSIQSVKAVEIGDGVENCRKFGSEAHDEIFYGGSFKRRTNRTGGIEGGVTNGEDVVARVYHKPISTLANPLKTVDIKTLREESALVERSDVCVIPRAGVISEAMLAYVLADEFLNKFGSDSMSDVKYNFNGYLKRLKLLK